MIYVVLGMHKSGTTLVSEILHHSGISMGDAIDEHVSYDQGNKYERQSVLALNMEILGTKELAILDLAAPDTLRITEEQRARMQEIIQNCNKMYNSWGFKDPRTCLVYPLWASELPEHRLIAIYRSPDEIWPRFKYKGVRHYHTNLARAWDAISRWYEHNTNVLSVLRDTPMDYLVLRYEDLVTTQAEFDRLQTFVGRELVDCRRPNLYRSHSSTYPLLKLAMWWLGKKTGYSVQQIMDAFDRLRV